MSPRPADQRPERLHVPTPRPVRRALTEASESVTAWRKLQGLTQAQVAERAGVAQSTVRKLEHGDGGISLELTLRVLRALGILETFTKALDPYETDVGRLRADEQLPQRVRTRAPKRA